MANFGFRRLSIVAPFALNWMEAKSAVGAPDLLREARVFASLAEAVASCQLVLGTGSLDRRKPEQTVMSLPEAAGHARTALGNGEDRHPPTATRIALVFGSEKHGLTQRPDLSWCHAIVVIDTARAPAPSMNLGQGGCGPAFMRSPDSRKVLVLPIPERSRVEKHPDSEQPASQQLDRLAALVRRKPMAAR